jgi:hypothetical protein
MFMASPIMKRAGSKAMRLDGATFPNGGSLNVFGIGSPNALKGRPARNVFFDELDEGLR